MKRRSFLGAAAASVFSGLAAMLGFGPRKTTEPAKQAQTTATDLASSHDLVWWNEHEQCFERATQRYVEGRKYKIVGGGWGIEKRCCERSPWWHRRTPVVTCDHCNRDINEAIRLIESGKVTRQTVRANPKGEGE